MKQRAKFEKAKARAEQDLVDAREKADKKIERIRLELQDTEAQIGDRLEVRRAKMQAKLGRAARPTVTESRPRRAGAKPPKVEVKVRKRR
jgi:hypothetical protein